MQATHSLTQAIVSRLAHDREDSRFTHASVPKTAVFCRVGKKENAKNQVIFSVLR